MWNDKNKPTLTQITSLIPFNFLVISSNRVIRSYRTQDILVTKLFGFEIVRTCKCSCWFGSIGAFGNGWKFLTWIFRIDGVYDLSNDIKTC